MSRTRHKIAYECECGIDYGSCGKKNVMYYTYYGVSDTFKIGVKYHIDEADSKIRPIVYGTDKDLCVLMDLLNNENESTWTPEEIDEFDNQII